MIIHPIPGIPPEFTYAATTVEEVSVHERQEGCIVVHLVLRLGAQHPGHNAGSFAVDIFDPDPMPAPGDIVNITLWQDVS